MNRGWKAKTLEEACQFSSGLWKGENPPFVKVGVIRNTNFTREGALNDSDIAYLDVEVKKFEKRRLQFGDIILEKSGGGPKQPVGRVALFDMKDGDFSFSNFTAAIRVLDPDELDFRFVHRFLHWTYVAGVTEGMQSNSTGIRNLDGDAYKAIEIRFPPLDEQKRIVAKLDEAFVGLAKAKENAEKNLQNARALFESHLDSVFTQRGPGWVEKRLGAVADVQSGGTPSVPERTYWGGNIPWYSSGELNEIHTRDPERTITGAGLNNSNAKLFPKGALLIGMYDTAALKMSILDREGTFNQAIAGVKPNERIEVEFVLHAINAIKPRLLLERRGVRQKNLSLGKIKEIAIPLPTPTEQRAVISSLRDILNETQRLTRLYEQKLEALESLKKSILHEAFSGNL